MSESQFNKENSNTMKQSKFFNTSKEQTHEFFKETKVGSCSHVLVKNGVSLAVPYKITNQKGKSLNNYKNVPQRSSETKSVYKSDFDMHTYMHAGMNSKPLMSYDPNSYRNRLATGGIIMPHKNKSIVEIGDRE
jgi:hypothetical protein